MINLDPVHFIKEKLFHLYVAFFICGLIFVFLGLGIIIYPVIIQYVFVIAFITIGILFVFAAARIAHISNMLSRFELMGGKKIHKRS